MNNATMSFAILTRVFETLNDCCIGRCIPSTILRVFTQQSNGCQSTFSSPLFLMRTWDDISLLDMLMRKVVGIPTNSGVYLCKLLDLNRPFIVSKKLIQIQLKRRMNERELSFLACQQVEYHGQYLISI